MLKTGGRCAYFKEDDLRTIKPSDLKYNVIIKIQEMQKIENLVPEFDKENQNQILNCSEG
jgi:hypothetical protein